MHIQMQILRDVISSAKIFNFLSINWNKIDVGYVSEVVTQNSGHLKVKILSFIIDKSLNNMINLNL